MNLLHQEFKKIAQENELKFKQVLADDYEKLWNLAEQCNESVYICRSLVRKDENKLLMIIMLRNCISDLLCCLDALERGHELTVQNNLRMVYEGICLVFHLYHDKTLATIGKFKVGKHKTQLSVTYAQRNFDNLKNSHIIYGQMSEFSHQSKYVLFARQIVISHDSLIITHIKEIDPDRFIKQIACLIMIVHLFRTIAELSEEICIDLLDTPYFLKKIEAGFQRNMGTNEAVFIQDFLNRMEKIYMDKKIEYEAQNDKQI